jgi:PAS domain S-box-containing protein
VNVTVPHRWLRSAFERLRPGREPRGHGCGTPMQQTPQHAGASSAPAATTRLRDRFRAHSAEIWSGFALALIALILVGTVSMLTTNQFTRNSGEVSHTFAVFDRLESLQQQITSVRSSTRAYVVTGAANMLASASEARGSIAKTLGEIRRLVADNPAQIERTDELRAAVARWLALADQIIAIHQNQGQTAALEFARTHDSETIAAEVNRRIDGMIAAEQALLDRRRSVEQDSARLAMDVSTYGTLAAVAFVIFAGVYIYKALRTLRTTTLLAERSARDARERGEELKAQAEVARLGREQFVGLLESATDAILTVDANGHITYANRRTTECFGYSLPELLGMEIEQLLPQASRAAHRGYRDAFIREPRVRPMTPDLDLSARRKDGTVFPVEVGLSPVTGQKGLQILATIRDVTQTRRAQEHRARIAALVEASRYAIISYTLDGTVLTWNEGARIVYGWRPEEMIGRDVGAIIPDRSMAEHLHQVEEIAAGRGAREYEAARRRKDGSLVQVAVSKAPIHDAHGKVAAISTISYDITERIRTERELRERTEELARSNADLEQFAYVASHDLQEPLRMVASYLQLIAQRYQGRLDADADDFINYAVDGARRMKQLINDLLNFSRAGRGPEPRPIDLNRALERALAILALAIEENHAVVNVDGLPRVMGDEARLAEVFQNLVSNAIKFRGAQPPRIRIGARREDGFWTISVADNGIGIDPAYNDRIFAMFQRLHGREEYSGTGIGLAICKRIVERTGGRIWVESEPGCGATFSFTLPAAKEDAGAQTNVSQS